MGLSSLESPYYSTESRKYFVIIKNRKINLLQALTSQLGKFENKTKRKRFPDSLGNLGKFAERFRDLGDFVDFRFGS